MLLAMLPAAASVNCTLLAPVLALPRSLSAYPTRTGKEDVNALNLVWLVLDFIFSALRQGCHASFASGQRTRIGCFLRRRTIGCGQII
jgi:hypothetical protein